MTSFESGSKVVVSRSSAGSLQATNAASWNGCENFRWGVENMWIAFSNLSRLVGLVVLFASMAHTVELPPAEQLQERIGLPARTVLVYEPHLSVGDKHVAIEYVGYRAVDVMALVFGKDWRSQAETIEFRALDGFVSHINISRFTKENAFIVFARKDNFAFTIDNIAQNQTNVPLGPYYLIWDNISNPALLAEGSQNWPYQVKEVKLVTLSDEALFPVGLDDRFHEGVELAKTYCLKCHKVNGFGGEKFEGNLSEIAKGYAEAEFTRLVLAPSSVRSYTTMPALPNRLSQTERQRIAKALFDYLNELPILR